VTKLSELWFFIPAAIASVYAPILSKRSATDNELYLHTLKKQTAMILYITYAICLFTTVFAPILIYVFFGEKYMAAVNPLRIHIWSLVFVALGTAQMAWNSIEKKQTLFLFRAIFGALACLGMYYLLIPNYSVMGAAVATTIAYSVPGLFSNAFHPATRKVFFMQLSVLIPTPKNIKLLFS
jgi:PST family polysaccharide transporter